MNEEETSEPPVQYRCSRESRVVSYMTLVPRGLQDVVRKILLTCLVAYRVEIKVIGEQISLEDVRQLEEKLSDKQQRGKKRERQETFSPMIHSSVGTLEQNISMGYMEENRTVWTVSGHLQGVVWIEFSTDAPPSIVGKIRCIGPLLATVQLWEDTGLGESQSLDEAVATLRENIGRSSYDMQSALTEWKAHAMAYWPLSSQQRQSLLEKLAGQESLRYRLSCMRTDSHNYKYTRQELLAQAATVFVLSDEWTVDLTKYDLEIVLLIRTHCSVVGLTLRPYQLFNAKSFSSGTIPPDISDPYLTGKVLSGLVRLKPSTAQCLLHLAQIEPGDVVLDPCAGIGTIPIECSFLNGVLALGGDLVLTPAALGSITARYMAEAQTVQVGLGRRASCTNLFAWDAINIPVRSESVDVVISDLPFGQQCLSTSRLSQLLPLLVAEMARVLRRRSGRMVLLCGSYIHILEALQQANADGANVWESPCSAIFPVNIGGLLAWVVKVKRGTDPAPRLPNHLERAKKLVRQRERVAQIQKGQDSNKPKRLQS